MRIVGIAATAVVAVIGAVSAAVGIRSIGDIKRYFKIRSM